MPRQAGFHVYSVKVRKKYQRETEVLSDILGKDDLLTILQAGLKQRLNAQSTDEAIERVACLKRAEVSERNILGLIEAGHYGESTNIVHSRSGQIVHVQGTEEAALLPCFFRLVIPKHTELGLLILQRDNRVQSKGALMSILTPILRQYDDELGFEVLPILNKQTFEKLVGEGQIQQLKFIRHSITQDFADEYDRGRHQIEGTMEVTVKAQRGKSLPMKQRLISWMHSADSVRDIFELPGLEGFEFDQVKADLRIGRNKRTVDFGKKLTNPIIDLTDKIQWRRGRPTWDSLVSSTLELAEDEMFDLEGVPS